MTTVRTIAGKDNPAGYQQITSLSAAQPLAAPSGAQWALITAEGQGVRWRDDGTNPTASVGWPLAVGQVFQYTGDLAAIRFIQQAASATLNITYYS